MNRELQDKVERIFHEAADLPTVDRMALLDERCAGDAGLREMVESLLRADTAHSGSPRLTRDRAAADAIGTEIGQYRITALIGEGGFGAVYLAEQSRPIRRRVALKVIKAGMDTRQVVARFEAERQVLALMEHPNIARVLDAGATPAGQPYFVMEQVPGVPVTRFCDEQRLGIDARLGLFLEVCSAIHHAHQKGVIHRDIKPSNILVEVIDGRAVPKVIDFGIAKAAATSLSGEGPRTERGGVLGTPEYMSPEQADMGGVDVDTRTDVYSLGVVLYELLTGVPPLDPRAVRQGPAADLARRLRDLPAVRPSTRLRLLSMSRSGPRQESRVPSPEAEPGGDAAPEVVEIAARRGCDLPALRRRLRGDLDWVLLRAMEKDRNRRYASVSDFAADIERHLRGHAVVARPPSTAYLARKFVRRHRAAAGAAALVAVVLVAATAISTVMAMREATHRREAERSRAETRLQSYEAHLAAAAVALEHGDYPVAERSLAAAPEELRGWEWRALSWRADRSLLRLPAHAGAMLGVIAPDGETLWTLDSAGEARAWDLSDGTLRHRVRLAVADRLLAVAADGRTLVTWTERGALTGWDTASGRPRWTLAEFGPDACGAPHPDGENLVVVSPGDGAIRTLNLRSGALGRALWEPAAPAFSPSCAPGGRWLVAQTQSGQAVVYDLRRGEVRATQTATGWCFGETGRVIHFIAPTSAMNSECRTLDPESGEVAGRPFAPIPRASVCEAAPDGRFVVTLDSAGTLGIWDEHSASPRTLYRHAGGCSFVRVTPDSRRVVSGGADGCVRVWDIRTGEAEHSLSFDWFTAGPPVAMSERLGAAASVGWGSVVLWDTATGGLRWSRTFSRHVIGAAAFAEDRGLLAALDERGALFLLRLEDGAPAGQWEMGIGGAGVRIAITPNASHLVATAADRTVIVDLGVAAPNQAGTPLPGGAAAMAMSPDGLRLALGVRGEPGVWSLRVFAVPSGAPVWEAPLGAAAPTCVTFHPRDGSLAVAVDDGAVVLLAANGAPVARVAGVASGVLSLAMHPTEPVVAAGADDGVLYLLRADTGRTAVALRNPWRRAIHAAAFSDDGASLMVGSAFSSVTSLATRAPVAGFGPRFLASSALGVMARSVMVARSQLGVDTDAQIAGDDSLPADVRDEAVRQARRFAPPANALNSTAWGLAREAGGAPDQYARALRASEAALSVFPQDASILNTHGLALYRVGRLEEAVEVLTRSDAHSVASGRGELPYNAAVLALALHRLGRAAEAQDALARTRRLAATPAYSQDWEVRLLLGEAEALLTEAAGEGNP